MLKVRGGIIGQFFSFQMRSALQLQQITHATTDLDLVELFLSMDFFCLCASKIWQQEKETKPLQACSIHISFLYCPYQMAHFFLMIYYPEINTARPHGTRPHCTLTSMGHCFGIGPKKFEMHCFTLFLVNFEPKSHVSHLIKLYQRTALVGI